MDKSTPWMLAQRDFCTAALELMESWKEEDYPAFDTELVVAMARLWETFKNRTAN